MIKSFKDKQTEVALRLARAFGRSAQRWLNLHTYDVRMAEREIRKELSKIERVSIAA